MRNCFEAVSRLDWTDWCTARHGGLIESWRRVSSSISRHLALSALDNLQTVAERQKDEGMERDGQSSAYFGSGNA